MNITKYIFSWMRKVCYNTYERGDMTYSSQIDMTDYIVQVMQNAGMLAAITSYQLKQEGKVNTTLLKPKVDNSYSLNFFLNGENITDLIDNLNVNPQTLPYQILAHQSYAYLPTGKIKAIRLEIRNYDLFPFSLVLAIPYVIDKQKFKVFSVVRYCHSVLSEKHFDLGMNAFYEAAFSFSDPNSKQSFWRHIFEEKIYYFPKRSLINTLFNEPEACFSEAIHVNKPQQRKKIVYENPFQDIKINKEIYKLPKHYRYYLQVSPPQWVKQDPIYQQVKNYHRLYKEGVVVWAALIDSNDQIFEPTGDNCLGNIVFDPKGQTCPKKLMQIAQKLKNSEPKEKDQQDFQDYLKRGDRLVNYPCPKSLAFKDLKLSSILLWRPHLPNGMLMMSCFPIIVPSTSYMSEVMVLPAWFWLPSLRHKWLAMAKEKFGYDYDLTPSIFKSLEHHQSLVPGTPQMLEPPLTAIFDDENQNNEVCSKVKIRQPILDEKPRKIILKYKRARQIDWTKWLTRLVIFSVILKVVTELKFNW